MLIERNDGYVYVPLDYWLVFFLLVLLTAMGLERAAWQGLLTSTAVSGLIGLMAMNSTFAVTRGPHDTLSVRQGWRRTEVNVGKASVLVEHAFKSSYRVVLSGGTTLAGEMLLGRSIRIAGRIATVLDVPLNVHQEQRDQAAKEKRTILLMVLFPIVATVLGSMLWLLVRR